MTDYEILRNGSGYVDPTAYKAIQNYQRGEDILVLKRGEIYEYEMQNGKGIKNALIVSADFENDNGYLNVIVLTDEEKTEGLFIPIVCGGMMYADCGMVSFALRNRIGNYVRTATDKEMAQIDAGIAKCLGIEQKTVEVPVEKVVEVPALVQYSDNTEELMQAKAEAGIYKDLYERLLAKVMG